MNKPRQPCFLVLTVLADLCLTLMTLIFVVGSNNHNAIGFSLYTVFIKVDILQGLVRKT